MSDRNLNPHAEARIAMMIWSHEYAYEQRGGSMDFWDSRTPGQKKQCVEILDKLLASPRSDGSPPANPLDIAAYAHQEAVTYAVWLRAGNSTGDLSEHAVEGLEKHFVHVIRHALSVRLGDLAENPTPDLRMGGSEPVAEIVPATTPAAEILFGRDIKFLADQRSLPIGTKLYAEPRLNGLSPWQGWHSDSLPWSAVKHKDAVCHTVFGPTWSAEDAHTLISFIEQTWPLATAPEGATDGK